MAVLYFDYHDPTHEVVLDRLSDAYKADAQALFDKVGLGDVACPIDNDPRNYSQNIFSHGDLLLKGDRLGSTEIGIIDTADEEKRDEEVFYKKPGVVQSLVDSDSRLKNWLAGIISQEEHHAYFALWRQFYRELLRDKRYEEHRDRIKQAINIIKACEESARYELVRFVMKTHEDKLKHSLEKTHHLDLESAYKVWYKRQVITLQPETLPNTDFARLMGQFDRKFSRLDVAKRNKAAITAYDCREIAIEEALRLKEKEEILTIDNSLMPETDKKAALQDIKKRYRALEEKLIKDNAHSRALASLWINAHSQHASVYSRWAPLSWLRRFLDDSMFFTGTLVGLSIVAALCIVGCSLIFPVLTPVAVIASAALPVLAKVAVACVVGRTVLGASEIIKNKIINKQSPSKEEIKKTLMAPVMFVLGIVLTPLKVIKAGFTLLSVPLRFIGLMAWGKKKLKKSHTSEDILDKNDSQVKDLSMKLDKTLVSKPDISPQLDTAFTAETVNGQKPEVMSQHSGEGETNKLALNKDISFHFGRVKSMIVEYETTHPDRVNRADDAPDESLVLDAQQDSSENVGENLFGNENASQPDLVLNTKSVLDPSLLRTASCPTLQSH